MAFITVDLNPPSSSLLIPSTVVPPGEVTASFNCAGCCPVSNTIFADPRTVCAARIVATSLGKPILTPPSDNASINIYTYAGPLPLNPRYGVEILFIKLKYLSNCVK